MKFKLILSILLISIVGTANATVLTFYAGEGFSYAMPQDYGDNVTSTLMGFYTYGENGEGFTPNVTVEYIGVGGNGLHYWRDSFSGTTGVLNNEDDGEDFTTFKLTAEAGHKVVLHSLLWSSYNGENFTVDSITVTDEGSNVLYNSGSFSTGGSHATINFGAITGQTLTVTANLTSAGSSNDSFGFDDVVISEIELAGVHSLVSEDFEEVAVAEYTSGNVGSALIIDPPHSPPTSGEEDFIQTALGATSWNPFTTKAVDMNTLGLEWSFSLSDNNPLATISFDYGTDEANDKAVVYRVLDADNADAVVGTGTTVAVSASYASFSTNLTLGAGNYKLQLVSDEYENYRGCMIDNVKLVAHASDTIVENWSARGDLVMPNEGGTNPNGQWSYGWTQPDFSTFTLLGGSGSLWIRSGNDNSVQLNTTASVINGGVAPGQMFLHPGSEPSPAVIRWTVPNITGTGTVHVAGEFYQGDSGLVNTAVRFNNSTSLWTGIEGAFDLTFDVVTGDTIDFAAYGHWSYGSTPIDAQIALSYAEIIPSNSLTVVSEHGSPTPPAGTNYYESGTIFTCSVNSVTSSLTNYSPTGWTGGGSVPSSGTSNSVEVTLTEDSIIAWSWQTNYWLDVTVSGSGTVSHVDGFYAKDSEQVLTATPDNGWEFAGWSGAATGTNEAFVIMTEPQTITAIFTEIPDPVSLTVTSAHGLPDPAIGVSMNDWNTTVTCSVANVQSGLTQYECTGWIGTGSIPSSGSSTQVTATLEEDSSITWNWQTNYWLDVTINGNGSFSHADGFYLEDSEQIITVTPDSGWLFMGWTGDASGTNEAFVTMDAPKAVTATFSDDADGDGLTNDEEAAYGSNPWSSDTDGDGFDDLFESLQGMSLTNDSSSVVDYIRNHDATFGLYTSNAVLDVAIGEMLIDVSGGNATLSLQLEESDDLVTWTNAGPAEVWSWPVDSLKKFFRVKSSK